MEEGFLQRGEALSSRMKDQIEALTSSLQSRFNEIDARREPFREGYEEIDRKRTQLCESYARQVDSMEWVKINVGGTSYNCRRSILTSIEGSMLEAVFSGRWDAMLPRDSQGRIYIDENPLIFGEVIRYLHNLEVRLYLSLPSASSKLFVMTLLLLLLGYY